MPALLNAHATVTASKVSVFKAATAQNALTSASACITAFQETFCARPTVASTIAVLLVKKVIMIVNSLALAISALLWLPKMTGTLKLPASMSVANMSAEKTPTAWLFAKEISAWTHAMLETKTAVLTVKHSLA